MLNELHAKFNVSDREIPQSEHSTDHTFPVNASAMFLLCKDAYLHSMGKSQDPETSIRPKPKEKKKKKKLSSFLAMIKNNAATL